jgi:antitoxin Phd
MKTYTYSEARQKLAELLNRARHEGRIQIRRRDGQVFVLQPLETTRSPLDVPAAPVNLGRGEILSWIKYGRDDATKRLIDRASSKKTFKPQSQRKRRN